MIGIYKITNLIDGKVYIGQSHDIDQRFIEHCNHHKFGVGKDIYELGKENFSFEVLEECSSELLDAREDYYIQKYNAIKDGYNNIRGGQKNIGESNSNVKLTEQDVYYIREAYKNHEKQKEVYEKYKDIISLGNFQHIWQGKTWTNIHMDVYTPENKAYYKSVKVYDYSYNKANRKLSDQDVYDIRESYKRGERKDLVYAKYQNNISKSYFDKLWNGCTITDIHMDVYTPENRERQRKQSISLGSPEAKFTDDEIMYYRRKHANGYSITELLKEAHEQGKDYKYCAFDSMIIGRQYKRLPMPAVYFEKGGNN